MTNENLLKEIGQEITKIQQRKFKKRKKNKEYRLEEDVITELSNMRKDLDLTYNQLFKLLIKSQKYYGNATL